jgi:hypothetical protein
MDVLGRPALVTCPPCIPSGRCPVPILANSSILANLSVLQPLTFRLVFPHFFPRPASNQLRHLHGVSLGQEGEGTQMYGDVHQNDTYH